MREGRLGFERLPLPQGDAKCVQMLVVLLVMDIEVEKRRVVLLRLLRLCHEGG